MDTTQKDNATFDVVSVSDLISEFKIDIIDFLKVDIEGSEAELFKKDAELKWLKFVKIIAIEIHDEFDCRESIEHILIDNQFQLSYFGELTVGINKNLIN